MARNLTSVHSPDDGKIYEKIYEFHCVRNNKKLDFVQANFLGGYYGVDV